jgi:hypothetical protein
MVLRSLKPSKNTDILKTEVDMFWFIKNIEKFWKWVLKIKDFTGEAIFSKRRGVKMIFSKRRGVKIINSESENNF